MTTICRRKRNVYILAALLVASCKGNDISVAHDKLYLDSVGVPASVNVLGWVPFWDQNRSLQSFSNHSNIVNHLSMFWYYLTPDGQIETYAGVNESKTTIANARANGATVFALIANSPDNGSNQWDALRVRETISDAASRQRHIEDLTRLAIDFGFDGINIDYEALERRDRQIFSAFIQELAAALHTNNKLLAVALHPKTAEYRPSEDNGSHAQDWKHISQHADQLHFMTYGEHVGSDHSGPIASLPWVEKIIKFALEQQNVPKDKLFLGIPLYAEGWKVNADGSTTGLNKELTYTDVAREVNRYDSTIQWDEDSASPYAEINTGNNETTLYWFENQQSVQRKLALMEHYGINNLAFWRLGGEDQDVWDSFLSTDGSCIDSPPTGDGWGWNGTTSCRLNETDASNCTDSPPVGDGWGWNGSTSCRLNVAAATCIDTPPTGDGWGWNGETSCRMNATGIACIDSPPTGDGWGWNGTQSCRI